MIPSDIIAKKRNGEELKPTDLSWFISKYLEDDISEAQMSALLMAIYFNGMTEKELLILVDEMIYSGHVIKFEKSDFKKEIDDTIFVDKNRVLESMNKKHCVILNSLTEDLHNGENPRYGRRGRIPGSLNIPFHELTDITKGCFKTPSECLEVFKKKGISINSRVLNYCGGGIAASLDAFVLLQLGYDDIEIYDNSMSEWATDDSLPIEI